MPRGRTGGRSAPITVEQIERAGRERGLNDLTVHGVAASLGVTPAALYRHVDGRAGLERLVGESLLAELRIPDLPDDDARAHLLRFAVLLREFVLAHPGMSGYLQGLFPRGPAGATLLARQITALTRRGYAPGLASVICTTVAGLAIAQTAADERRMTEPGTDDVARQYARSRALLVSDAVLAEAHANLPEVSTEELFRMVMTMCVDGVLAAAPPERSVAELVAALDTGLPIGGN